VDNISSGVDEYYSIYNLEFLNNLKLFEANQVELDEYQHKGIQYDSIILFLTNQCNLKCTYCYASAGEDPVKKMSWEIAKSGIDLVANQVVNKGANFMYLGFHGGGEPSLNLEILMKATEYTRSITEKNNLNLNIAGAFNGYWTNKTRDFIIKKFTDISLSYDGMPLIQNSQRPTINSMESYSKVKETLIALDEARFSYGIRMTCTNEFVHRLEENIAFICENFKPRKIQVEPAFNVGRARKNKLIIADDNAFISQFIKGYKIAREHNIYLSYSGTRVDALIKRFAHVCFKVKR
jgi:uncharacterized protein